MDWTKELPVGKGYYWHRRNKYKDCSIYYVFLREGVMHCRWCHSGLYDLNTVEEVKGEWWGPLVEPPI